MLRRVPLRPLLRARELTNVSFPLKYGGCDCRRKLQHSASAGFWSCDGCFSPCCFSPRRRPRLRRSRTRRPTTSSPPIPTPARARSRKSTLGLLPNPFEKQGVKFAVTYIGESARQCLRWHQKQSAIYEDRINFAVDVDFEKLIGLKQLTFHANVFQIDGGGLSRGDSAELHGGQRHRGLADDAAVRNLVRAEMGEHVRACGRASSPPIPSS